MEATMGTHVTACLFMAKMYQNILQQVIQFQASQAVAQVQQQMQNEFKRDEYLEYQQPPRPTSHVIPQRPKQSFSPQKRVDESSHDLKNELQNLYGELGTMLATKKFEIQSQSRFVSQPQAMKQYANIEESHLSLQADSFKFKKNRVMDESLSGNSKFVKIPPELQEMYANAGEEEDIPLDSLVETWKDNDFPKYQSDRKQSTKKSNKFVSKARHEVAPEDEIDEDIENFDRDSSEEDDEDEKMQRREESWKKRHDELLNAHNLLNNAMREANDFIDRDKNMDALARESHKQQQLNKANDINAELDLIEQMIQEQNDSNVKNKRGDAQENYLKSASKHSAMSSQDPFDKLEDVGRSVSAEEIQEMRKTAKTQKQGQRLPWAKQGKKVNPRTDYNEEPQLNSPQQKSDRKASEKNKDLPQVKQSGRYDYRFEGTDEQKIYESPEPYQHSTRGIDVEHTTGEINIAASSDQNSSDMFSAHRVNRAPARTQDNFHKNTLKETPNSYHRSLYSDPDNLNQELWKQNFEALKTNYLKVMGKVNEKNKAISQYKFDDSDEEKEATQKEKSFKEKSRGSNRNIPPPEYKPSDNNQYEKYIKTFKDGFDDEDEEEDNSARFDEFAPSIGLDPQKIGTTEVKEVSMDKPKYGSINKSIEHLDNQFKKTNSDNKSLDFEVDSFNWDEEDPRKSSERINLGQYEEEDKDDYGDDDFEEEERQEQHKPAQEENSSQKQSYEKVNFTQEEEQIIKEWGNDPVLEESLNSRDLQVREIAELIDMATKDLPHHDKSYKFNRAGNTQEGKKSAFKDNKEFESSDRFNQSHSTNNDNPFTKNSNFLAYHTIEHDKDSHNNE